MAHWSDAPASDARLAGARLADDLAVCREQLRRGSRSFFAASLLLPRRVFAPATALYAFCRLADDAVDLDGTPVASLHERLRLAYAGMPLAIPADRAFAAMVHHHAIPIALPEALLDGFAWDAEGRRCADLPALHDYAARVAGSVGAMMALLMGVRDPGAVARATDLGIAMQLSNIARDVGEDARAGRLYLPLDWLADEGIDADAWLADPIFTPALGRVVARLLAEADRLYAQAAIGIGRLPASCRPGIAAASLIYAEIGRKVIRAGHDSVTRRTRVSTPRKLALLARSLAALAPLAHRSLPPLPAVGFLLDAVATAPAPRPPRRRSIDERIAWVVELFARLDQKQIDPGRQLES